MCTAGALCCILQGSMTPPICQRSDSANNPGAASHELGVILGCAPGRTGPWSGTLLQATMTVADPIRCVSLRHAAKQAGQLLPITVRTLVSSPRDVLCMYVTSLCCRSCVSGLLSALVAFQVRT